MKHETLMDEEELDHFRAIDEITITASEKHSSHDNVQFYLVSWFMDAFDAEPNHAGIQNDKGFTIPDNCEEMTPDASPSDCTYPDCTCVLGSPEPSPELETFEDSPTKNHDN